MGDVIRFPVERRVAVVADPPTRDASGLTPIGGACAPLLVGAGITATFSVPNGVTVIAGSGLAIRLRPGPE